jgi:hypothetical protein
MSCGVPSNRSAVSVVRMVPLLVVLCGCGGGGLAGGGTTGEITFDGLKVADLQVALYSPSGDCVAMGTSDFSGRFELKHPETVEPVSLFAGRFRITVQSVAADPVPVAPKYTALASTPLLREWAEGDSELKVEVTSK